MALFDRLVTGRHSPPNACHAQDGEPLIVRPKRNVPVTATARGHRFSTLSCPTKLSTFGWVTAAPHAFTIDEFLASADQRDLRDEETVKAVELMVVKANRFAVGTPLGVTYFRRGIEHVRMELVVHKVLFAPRLAR